MLNIELYIFFAGNLANSVQNSGDFWDDEWDDDSEIGQTQAYVPPVQQQNNLQYVQSGSIDHNNDMPMHTVHSVIPERLITNVPKKNNKFGNLVKSGEESFLLSLKKVIVPDFEKIYIEEIESGKFSWAETGESYSCVVTSPKKESKLKGLKSFIVYQLTPTVS